MKYSIIIPTYNHLDLLQPCLESVIRYTSLEDCEIIVVSNGCKDETKNYLEDIEKSIPIKSLFFSEPLGYSKAINEGIKTSSGEYIILLNNDTILLPQEKNRWLHILEKPFLEDEKCAISGPLDQYLENIDVRFIVFFCVMIKKSVIEKIGLLDEEFGIGGYEDADFCIIAVKNGFSVYCISEKDDQGKVIQKFPIYHSGEKTVKDEECVKDWQKVFDNNFEKLCQKHNLYKKHISIIMPAYNSEKFIEKSINSVLSQSYNNLTLFIINDNSTDKTLEICEDFAQKDKRIKIIQNGLPEGNLGPSECRNKALETIQKNKSDYVAFCDSDDIWGKDHLSNSMQAFRESQADMVYSDVSTIFEDGSQAFPYGIPYFDQPSAETLTKQNYIYISSVVLKTSCVAVAGSFDSQLDSIEDWDYWLRIMEKGMKIYHNPVKDVVYLVRQSSMASKNNAEKTSLFREKHKIMENKQIKLNLGCGDDVKEEYINCDLYSEKADMKFDAKKIPMEDNSVDEIFASHLIEHFDFKEGFEVLKEWNRVLKPGGKVVLETPDLLNTCKRFVEADEGFRVRLYGHFFAWPWMEGQCHKFLYTENQLRWTLQQCGFADIKRVPPTSIYVLPKMEDMYLKMEAVKKMSPPSMRIRKCLTKKNTETILKELL